MPIPTDPIKPGDLELIDTGELHLFAFRRIKGSDRVNLSAQPKPFAWPGETARLIQSWGWSITTRP